MYENSLREKIFLGLTKALKELIKKVEELLETIRSNNPRDYLGREWIDSYQLRQLLNISNRTLQTYMSKKDIPYSKFNGKVYFRPRDIEDILNRNYTGDINPQKQ